MCFAVLLPCRKSAQEPTQWCTATTALFSGKLPSLRQSPRLADDGQLCHAYNTALLSKISWNSIWPMVLHVCMLLLDAAHLLLGAAQSASAGHASHCICSCARVAGQVALCCCCLPSRTQYTAKQGPFTEVQRWPHWCSAQAVPSAQGCKQAFVWVEVGAGIRQQARQLLGQGISLQRGYTGHTTAAAARAVACKLCLLLVHARLACPLCSMPLLAGSDQSAPEPPVDVQEGQSPALQHRCPLPQWPSCLPGFCNPGAASIRPVYLGRLLLPLLSAVCAVRMPPMLLDLQAHPSGARCSANTAPARQQHTQRQGLGRLCS